MVTRLIGNEAQPGGTGIDLAKLAAGLSRADGDGHRWDEDDARHWLRRMGYVAAAGSDGHGAELDDPRLLELLQKAG